MWDIVYFVKDSVNNEELRYSLRSLRNFPHHKVWFYGGCPKGLRPDCHVAVKQNQKNKWENVSMMLRMACVNDMITKKFWLFNDDFFIMEKVSHPTNYYRGDFYKRIVQLEDKYNCMTSYSKMLRETAQELEILGLPTKDYTLHIPMLFDRDKALELFRITDCCGFRSLYGNYCQLADKSMGDCKIVSKVKIWNGGCYLSTDDEAFSGAVGNQIKAIFTDKCEYEE